MSLTCYPSQKWHLRELWLSFDHSEHCQLEAQHPLLPRDKQRLIPLARIRKLPSRYVWPEKCEGQGSGRSVHARLWLTAERFPAAI